MSSMIMVENLVFDYPGHRVLDGLSFTVPQGSISALVGVNGVGKTTLLRCLAGLSMPHAGEVHINGFNTQDASRQVHEQIGYLSDFFGLYDDLTVAQCLEVTMLTRPTVHDDVAAAIRQVAGRVQLEDHLNKKAQQLSRGLRQRLGIAQAIVHQPKLLILDEPASGLDPLARSELATLLLALQEEGMTLLVSSHILTELEAYSTHMLHLRDAETIYFTEVSAEALQGAPTLVITPLEASPRLLPFLESMPHVSAVSPQEGGRDITFQFHGDEAARAALLTQVVGQGHAISALYERKQDFQTLFLQQIPKGEGLERVAS
ncbi:MAG: ABC transporter ATP-binding protein [Magnetococcales bacterium]|nr:ABC transporter ATP-binding protein [Magnetococcales bacterium]